MNIARRSFALIVFALFLVGGWRFAAGNEAPTRVYLWIYELQGVPLWQVLAIAFSSGAALVGFLAGYLLAKGNLTQRRYRSALAGLEAELHQLRSLPLAEREISVPRELAGTNPGEGGSS